MRRLEDLPPGQLEIVSRAGLAWMLPTPLPPARYGHEGSTSILFVSHHYLCQM